MRRPVGGEVGFVLILQFQSGVLGGWGPEVPLFDTEVVVLQ